MTDFNFSFNRPHTDTCKKCDAFKVKTDAAKYEVEKTTLADQCEIHKRKAQTAQDQLKIDGSLTNREVDNFSFDLHKAMPTPALTTGV